ncbi:MAG: Na/Pi symporter [Planctomycetota bacterium]
MTKEAAPFTRATYRPWRTALLVIEILALLYLFFFSIKLMESSFRSFGEGSVHHLLSVVDNPLAGLMIGILITSIVQSSSFTTTQAVIFVATGALSIRSAIPIVMGANIGTTITNTLVSLGHVTRREEFRRAYPAAVVHDVFNVLTVAVLFPIEIKFHYLERAASTLAGTLTSFHAGRQQNLLQKAIQPLVDLVRRLLIDRLEATSKVLAGVVCLLVAVTFLFLALYLFVRVIRGALFNRVESILDAVGFRRGTTSLFLGFLITAVVQSSSVTTSLIVPLTGAGLLTLEQAYPFTLGANIGTTFTAVIGSLVAGTDPALHVAGITVALTHLLFNMTGVLLFYPVPFLRKIPLGIARGVGAVVAKRRYMAGVLVVVLFFVIPLLCFYVGRLLAS